jgi:hypothetical protein
VGFYEARKSWGESNRNRSDRREDEECYG